LDDIAPGFVAVARVLGAWGVHGEIKIEPLAPESVLAPGRTVRAGRQDHTIEESRGTGGPLLLKLSGVDTREAARALHGKYLAAPERTLEPLTEGEYYRFQLLGLAVRSIDGAELGRVADVFSTPHNDVYVVDGPHGEVLLPAVDDVIRSVNLTEGVITVDIIPGLLP
jgi:16S rRNA processing protein RimM